MEDKNKRQEELTRPKDKVRTFLANVAVSLATGITRLVYSGPIDFRSWYELRFSEAGGIALDCDPTDPSVPEVGNRYGFSGNSTLDLYGSRDWSTFNKKSETIRETGARG
jgi:hypothetical protein